MNANDRAKRAFDALDEYAGEHGQTHTQVREILHDFRHFCRQEGLCFADLDALAELDFSEYREGLDYDVVPRQVKESSSTTTTTKGVSI